MVSVAIAARPVVHSQWTARPDRIMSGDEPILDQGGLTGPFRWRLSRRAFLKCTEMRVLEWTLHAPANPSQLEVQISAMRVNVAKEPGRRCGREHKGCIGSVEEQIDPLKTYSGWLSSRPCSFRHWPPSGKEAKHCELFSTPTGLFLRHSTQRITSAPAMRGVDTPNCCLGPESVAKTHR